MKRILAIVMAAAMLTLAACGSTGASAAPPAAQSGGELKFVELDWNTGERPCPDDEMVIEALNAYYLDKLNVKINFIYMTYPEMREKYPVMLSSGQDMGICVVGAGYGVNYVPSVRLGAFEPLDNLLANTSPELKSLISEPLWDAMKVDGKIYGVPSLKDNCYIMTGWYNATLMDELGIDMSKYPANYSRVSDYEGLLMELAEKLPDRELPLYGGPQDWPHNFAVETFVDYFLAAVCNLPGINDIAGKDSETVFNMFETAEYYDYAKMLQRFVQNGIMPKEDLASPIPPSDQVFGTSWGVVYMSEHQMSQDWSLKLLPAARTWTSTNVIQLGAGISAMCKDKERAMMAISLMNTDPDLATLFRFGIEGEHYVYGDDGKMTFDNSPRNGDPSARGYYRWYAAPIGNLLIARAPESLTGPDAVMFSRIADFNAKAVPGHMGFLVEQDPIINEFAAVNAVISEYRDTINKGRLPSEADVVKYVDEFNSQLYANGLQKLIDEFQKQLDTWKAAN